MQLSESQEQAYQYIITNLPRENIILLEGSAGTGKTTLTKAICRYYRQTKNAFICAIAPTHKSKKIIKNMLEENTLFPVTAMTVAAALGKIKEHSYVGTKTYSKGNSKKLSTYHLFIIDEVSMIHDTDLKTVIDFIRKNGKQLLIIGDKNQIPCPNAPYIVTEESVSRSDSFIFTDERIPKLYLTQIVRQALDSPIINLSVYVKDHLLMDEPFHTVIQNTKFNNVIPYDEIYDTFVKFYNKEQVNSCRIVTYTNTSVKTHNLQVRNRLNYHEPYVVGELLTGYSNIGYPELIIENGEDYFIKKITETTSHTIGTYKNLCGKLIELQIANVASNVKKLFFIDIYHDNNEEFISRLIELAVAVNGKHSTKNDYSNYMKLKNSVIFIEDIYYFQDGIYTETTFKETHSLLFMNVNEIIVDNQVKETTISTKIETMYPGIIQERLEDCYKMIGDSETFADKYKSIEKDLYYGYSITAHKSQGSTYQTVIADEGDFQKIKNKWNNRYNKLEDRIKEKKSNSLCSLYSCQRKFIYRTRLSRLFVEANYK